MTTVKLPFGFSVMFFFVVSMQTSFFTDIAVSQEADQIKSQCIRNCRHRFGSDFLWGGGGSNLQLYYLCLDDCEKEFWKQWDIEMSGKAED